MNQHYASWRDDIDALAFQPAGHDGLCMVDRRAIRTLVGHLPSAAECLDYLMAHRPAFEAAARAMIIRANLQSSAQLHLTSRDIAGQQRPAPE
jgi:hypothetical protein